MLNRDLNFEKKNSSLSSIWKQGGNVNQSLKFPVTALDFLKIPLGKLPLPARPSNTEKVYYEVSLSVDPPLFGNCASACVCQSLRWLRQGRVQAGLRVEIGYTRRKIR